MKKTLLALSLASLIATPAMAGDHKCPKGHKITTVEVEAAQAEWGAGIVAIGASEDAPARAKEHLDTLYAYDLGTVLFKPTLAAQDQFRGTFNEAHSYFVGGDIAEDKGFALAPYTAVRFENEGIITGCGFASAMGNYFFTKTDGSQVKVEYAFGYVKGEDGDLKINLHHSSLPFGG